MPDQPLREWLTVTEAAHLHIKDVDGLTLARAKARVGYACKAGQVAHIGCGNKRRIEPNSFDAWRLKERERNLDEAE